MHVPKVAGTSVETWLESLAPLQLSTIYNSGWTHSLRCTPQHFDAHDIRCLFRDGYFDYAFLFVRDPYARMESEYRYLCAQKKVRSRLRDFGRTPDFATWAVREMKAAEQDPWALDNHLRPQWEFAYPGADRFRLEDGLTAGLTVAAARMGVPAPETAPALNRTAGMDIRTAWTDEARAHVARRYARDFQEFGYAV
jgi:hypothetical protein